MAQGPRLAGPPFVHANRGAAALAILGFSVSLGAGVLALPLLALEAGFEPAWVGAFAAISAVAQIAFRLSLPWLLRRFADRDLTGAACLMIVGSYALLLVSTTAVAFCLSHVLQGSARAVFWTSSQTHAVRNQDQSVSALARVQLVGNIGTLSGPALAGILSGASLDLALWLGVAAGAVGLGASRFMDRLPPFIHEPRQPGEPRIWQRPGVDVGCWASYAAGGWRALLGSYFPVVLADAGHGSLEIGLLLGLADGASFVAAATLARWVPNAIRVLVEAAVLTTTVAIVLLPAVAGHTIATAATIAVGGWAAGLLLTLGTAIASDAVAPNERGDAIAAAGVFRAGALFATPAAVAGGLALSTLPAAIALAGVMLGAPTLASSLRLRLRRRVVS